jgi:hypothetical protein
MKTTDGGAPAPARPETIAHPPIGHGSPGSRIMEPRRVKPMSNARLEILKLVAEGKISPEEAERLLRGADEGRPAGTETPPTSGGGKQGIGETLSQVFDHVGDTVRGALEDAAGAMQKVFEEHRPGTEGIDTTSGAFDLPEGARLKVQQAFRVSYGGASRGGHVGIRPANGPRARILRGEAVEVHRSGTDFVLTWAKGDLDLEVPSTLAALDVRSLGGDIEVHDFTGPLGLETMGGEIRAFGVRSSFRARSLGGPIRMSGLAIREGSSRISTTGGDVTVEAAADCSATIRASTLGGTLTLPAGASQEITGARRRVTAVLGDGKAELRVDTLGGDVVVKAG